MKKIILFFFACCVLLSPYTKAQSVVVDAQHTAVVIENGAVRSAAEKTQSDYLGNIDNNLTTVNNDFSTVILAQTIIYNSLANVNSALKNGLALKNISSITGDIIYYLGRAQEMGKDQPWLFLFVNQYQNMIGQRVTALVSDISGFVMKEGDNMLADYNSRDQLLRRITQQLQIIDGLAYGAYKAMFWTAQRGLINSINPYAKYINKDKSMASQIIINANHLH